jgi:TolB-like protein/Tfp pilus assembly protein PilF
MSKWSERKIAQWGLGYLAAAWLSLQVLQYLADSFGWPSQVQRIAAVVALVGLIVTLVLAWYHGERGRQRVSIAEAVLLALVLVGGGALAWVFRGNSTPEKSSGADALPVEQNSIAVLPFTQSTANQEDDYFGDGIAEEILDALAKTPGLRVAARTSSFSFKGVNAPVEEIGKKLHVAHVLDGSVRREGNVVRITVQLVDAAKGYQLWSEKFDRELKDIFKVQEEVSRAIVDKLQIHLTRPQQALAARTSNNEAFDLYMRGRYFLAKRTQDALPKAEQHFVRALALDPNFADAHAGLAATLLVLPLYVDTEVAAVRPRARAAAERAVELDSALADGWAALAYVRMSYDHDWAGAESAFKKAERLNPNDANTQLWFGDFESGRGNTAAGVRHYARGVQLDPLSAPLHLSLGWGHSWTKRFEEAANEFSLAIELDPTLVDAHTQLARTRFFQGRQEEGVRGLEQAVERSQRRAIELGLLGNAYAKIGRTSDAQRILAELKQRRAATHFSALPEAMVYIGLGDFDRAFESLEDARREGEMWLTENNLDLVFEPLHADRRWNQLRKRMGIEQ